MMGKWNWPSNVPFSHESYASGCWCARARATTRTRPSILNLCCIPWFRLWLRPHLLKKKFVYEHKMRVANKKIAIEKETNTYIIIWHIPVLKIHYFSFTPCIWMMKKFPKWTVLNRGCSTLGEWGGILFFVFLACRLYEAAIHSRYTSIVLASF